MEVILDTSIYTKERSLRHIIDTCHFLERAGYPLQIRLVYPRELFREQTDLLHPDFLGSTDALPSAKHKAPYVGLLRQLNGQLKVLGDDAQSVSFNQGVLTLAKAVARRTPGAPCVRAALTDLGFETADQLSNMSHVKPWQQQILFNHFVAGKVLEEAYPGLRQAKELQERRKDSADDSVIDYVRRLARRPETMPAMTIFISNDQVACKKVSRIEPPVRRERIMPMSAEQFDAVLQGVIDTCDQKHPGFQPPRITHAGQDAGVMQCIKTLTANQSKTR